MEPRWLKNENYQWEFQGEDKYPGTVLAVMYDKEKGYTFSLGMTTDEAMKGESGRTPFNKKYGFRTFALPVENGEIQYWQSLTSAKANAEEQRYNPALLERAGIQLQHTPKEQMN